MCSFETAAEQITGITNIKTDDLLRLYGLYKVATKGPVDSQKPWGFDFEAAAKWNAWKEASHLDQIEAKKEYIKIANKYISLNIDPLMNDGNREKSDSFSTAVKVSTMINDRDCLSYFILIKN